MLARLTHYITMAGPMAVVLLSLLIFAQSSRAESLPPSFVFFRGDDEVEAPPDFDPLGGEVRLILTENPSEVVRAELHGLEMIHPGTGERIEFTRTPNFFFSVPLVERRFTLGLGSSSFGKVISLVRLDGELSEDGTAISGTATWVVGTSDWVTREFRVERIQTVAPGTTDNIVRAVTYTNQGSSGSLVLTVDDSGNLTSVSLKGVSFGGCSLIREPSQQSFLIDDPQPLVGANAITLGGRSSATLTVIGTSTSGPIMDGVLVYSNLFGCEITIDWTTGEIPATASPTSTATATVPDPTSSPESVVTKTPIPGALPQAGTGGGNSDVVPGASVALAVGGAALLMFVVTRRRAGRNQ